MTYPCLDSCSYLCEQPYFSHSYIEVLLRKQKYKNHVAYERQRDRHRDRGWVDFVRRNEQYHYGDVIMGAIASQITSLMIVYSTVYSDADQRKHQSAASLAFVRGIYRGPVNSPHKWPVTRKMFPFDDVIILCELWMLLYMLQRNNSDKVFIIGWALQNDMKLLRQCM